MDISAIQFEAARLHFLSDVFVTVAVVVARTPYSTMATGVTGKMTGIRGIFFDTLYQGERTYTTTLTGRKYVVDSKIGPLLYEPVNINSPAVRLPAVCVMCTDNPYRLFFFSNLCMDIQGEAVITS